jgi:hypothetical protein
MMVQLYASSGEEFVRQHGTIGAQRYLRATTEGLIYRKQIAQEIGHRSNHCFGQCMSVVGVIKQNKIML